ncbi:hypothetical protein F511_44499 [Dorcoceras hygrometricum]|uniref:Uncharacterized protein n=1 Tax=Dorcoceras hygrometricum TaxID=472368 RepID=A0A2Z6ZZ02_9LAMI|nr:hypothetical protein F511_44499 [Dorcoceras hygrometricum]
MHIFWKKTRFTNFKQNISYKYIKCNKRVSNGTTTIADGRTKVHVHKTKIKTLTHYNHNRASAEPNRP